MKYDEQIVTAYYTQQGLPKPVFELQHIPGRKFRLDIAWPNDHVKDSGAYCGGIGIEVQGGIWMPISGHKSGVHIKRDYEKNNLSLLNGWRVLYIEPKEVCLLSTVNMVKQLMGIK